MVGEEQTWNSQILYSSLRILDEIKQFSVLLPLDAGVVECLPVMEKP